ncbi:uncharacterized protein LOC132270307 [Cornus florida]|uniref:uncharacterized protein LOC132270307 n=1 Tax=Cornus florida TaxID=4283 RepID=UPI00289876A7|nr:uncharacterized protein LOC132270307 [Cornus florida]
MAQANAGNPDKIMCHCRHCLNACYQHFDIVFAHVVMFGIEPTYKTWVFHGESPMSQQDEGDRDDVEMTEACRMYRNVYFSSDDDGDNDDGNDIIEPTNEGRETEFKIFLEDTKRHLYPSCTKYTRISAIIALYKHKTAYNLSDTGFSALLKIVDDMLPDDNTLPLSFYETKKLLKTFDLGYEKIHAYPKNLRLGLSSDGFNPFGDLSSRYSCWPVMYNLPELSCMSKENMILTLLIPGPKQQGNDIDVYLQPLIEDLKELWDKGVEVYDAHSKMRFNLKAVLMWTMNDLPAFSNLSGYGTKGKTACPTCDADTCSQWLIHCKKHVYLGHRRFLSYNHPFRRKKRWLNGNEERRGKPKILSGTDILRVVKNIKKEWGKYKKQDKKRKKCEKTSDCPWKKKFIFFELPYWEVLLLRHNLDVMHIEKNVCESIIGTLLDMKGKSKDGLNSHLDLQEMCIRDELHPIKRDNKFYLPAGPHTLLKMEKRRFCERLQQLKLPDGYSSNIGKCVLIDECKILGLKSHDYHVLMQQLLPVALRGSLQKGSRNAIF